MTQVLCFGEALLRVSPVAGWPLDPAVHAYVGGAEVNVALALAQWGIVTKICTALPQNFVSERIARYLDHFGVHTSPIIYEGARVGTYYLNQGADLKSAGVVYDRAFSSFATLQPGTVNWREKLEGITHLHLTAISPAVSQPAADVCKELLEEASKKGIIVSLDLNYRDKLWKYGKSPLDIIPGLAEHATIIMGNIWAANRMLGMSLNRNVEKCTTQEEFLAEAEYCSRLIEAQFPKCTTVANTFRFNLEGARVKYFATLYRKGEFVSSEEKIYGGIVDKAGSGDCFMAGLLYGLSKEKELQRIVDFATTAATGKLYEVGDHTRQKIEDIERKMNIHE